MQMLQPKRDTEKISAQKCHHKDTKAQYSIAILAIIVVLKKLHKEWLEPFS